MNGSFAFISHSHTDKAFAELLAKSLREADLSAWIDNEKILVGETILDGIGHGLTTTDVLIFVISKTSLKSEWCKRELDFVTHREINEKRILIVPVIIDDTAHADLPWHLQTRNSLRVQPNVQGAKSAVASVRQVLMRRFSQLERIAESRKLFIRDSQIDQIIANVELGDWRSAQLAAIEVLKLFDDNGHNAAFEKLLSYCDSEDQHWLWRAIQTIESCVSLAPRLINYETLRKLASHRSYTVRSSAASICMDLANFAPDCVPVDILLTLSVYDEDWYVQAPANAALKTLAHSMPGVLRIFFSRLDSTNKDECAHSAAALRDIAKKEPGLLELAELKQHLAHVKMLKYREAAQHLQMAVNSVRGKKRSKQYRYGL